MNNLALQVRSWRLTLIGSALLVLAMPGLSHSADSPGPGARTQTVNAQAISRCARCHGADGGTPRSGDIPAIAGQHHRVLLKELSDFRYGKRWATSMRRATDPHTLGIKELLNIAKAVSEMPWRPTLVRGNGTQRARGAEIYQARCVACHGQSALGSDDPPMPRLAGQSYEYLLRQMDDGASDFRGNLPRDHVTLLRSLKRTDFVGVADHLSALNPVSAP